MSIAIDIGLLVAVEEGLAVECRHWLSVIECTVTAELLVNLTTKTISMATAAITIDSNIHN